MAKKSTKKQMVCAEGELCFWVNSGPVLKDLNELRDALKNMSEDSFFHHVSDEKNDFAKWVDEALQDADLAQKLYQCKDIASMLKAVETHIKKNY